MVVVGVDGERWARVNAPTGVLSGFGRQQARAVAIFNGQVVVAGDDDATLAVWVGTLPRA